MKFKKPHLWLTATLVGMALMQFQNCSPPSNGGGAFDLSTIPSVTVNLSMSTTSPTAGSPVEISVQLTSSNGAANNVVIGLLVNGAQTTIPSCVFESVASGGSGASCTYTPTETGTVSLYVNVSSAAGSVIQTCSSATVSGCEGIYQLNVIATGATPTPTPSGAATPTPTPVVVATPTPTPTPVTCNPSGYSCGQMVTVQCEEVDTTSGSIAQCASCCNGYQDTCSTQTCPGNGVTTCNYTCR